MFRRKLTAANFDQSTYDHPHHVVDKVVGLNSDGQDFVVFADDCLREVANGCNACS